MDSPLFRKKVIEHFRKAGDCGSGRWLEAVGGEGQIAGDWEERVRWRETLEGRVDGEIFGREEEGKIAGDCGRGRW